MTHLLTVEENTPVYQTTRPTSVLLEDEWYFYHQKGIENSTIFVSSIKPDKRINDLISKLMDMEALEYNWDSYGAVAPEKNCIHKAIKFIISNAQYALPFYFTAPGVNGEIMVELKNGNRSAEIFFNPDNTNELLLFENSECIFEGDVDKDFSQLMDFLNE